MKLIFTTTGKSRRGREVFNQKITSAAAAPREPLKKRRRLGVSKASRLVTIDFACSLDFQGKYTGYLTLSEAEILLLAKLCRRERSDTAFLEAINAAGEVAGVARTRIRRNDDAPGSTEPDAN